MFTIVSTIGYGIFTPSTWQGRLFTCCFAVPGMILFGEAVGALLSAPCVVTFGCRICYYSIVRCVCWQLCSHHIA